MEKKRILYVTSNAINNVMYIDDLKENGFEVCTAVPHAGASESSIDIAMNLIRDQEFDLIITEMYMPYGSILDPIETQNGWNTGQSFIKLVRDSGNTTPFLVYELSTGFARCEHYDPASSTIDLGDDYGPVPVVLKDSSETRISDIVIGMIGSSSRSVVTMESSGYTHGPRFG